MSTKGKEKWEKYFSHASIKTTVSCKYDYNVNVYDCTLKNVRIDTLKDGDEIEVLKLPEYEPKYKIIYNKNETTYSGLVSGVHVKKPMTKRESKIHRLNPQDFCSLGDDIILNGQTYKQFCSYSQLSCSIIDSLKNYSVDTSPFIEFLESKMYIPINWDKISIEDINRFGVVLSELFIGAEYLLNPNTKFLIPVSNNHPGIDCILVTSENKFINISCKYGKGATPSFFSNFIPHIPLSHPVKECYNKTENSIHCVYEFVLNHIFDLGIKDTYSIYKIAKSGKYCKRKFNKLKNDIFTKSALSEEIKDCLLQLWPKSITATLTREMAKYLNCIDDDILSAYACKDFYQIHVDTKKWSEGFFRYTKFHCSEKYPLFFGNKSAMNDISAKQGTIVYELREITK